MSEFTAEDYWDLHEKAQEGDSDWSPPIELLEDVWKPFDYRKMVYRQACMLRKIPKFDVAFVDPEGVERVSTCKFRIHEIPSCYAWLFRDKQKKVVAQQKYAETPWNFIDVTNGQYIDSTKIQQVKIRG